ncbi:MAG: ComEC/Rec2 family competence protein [Microcoleus sp.]
MWRYRKLRSATIVIALSIGILIGLLLPQIGITISGWQWLLVVTACLLTSLKRQIPTLITLIVGSAILGCLQGSGTLHELQQYAQYIGHPVTVRGLVSEDPTHNQQEMQQVIIENIDLNGQHMIGQLQFTTAHKQAIERGDTVSLSGKLQAGFGSLSGKIGFAKVNAITPTHSGILEARRTFSDAVHASMIEPQASLGLGFVIGENAHLPSSISDQMKQLSLTHIIVASGYNLTILVRLSRRLFAKHSKYLALVTSIGLMGGFLLVTGFSPSMSRAGLVTGLVLWAWYYGRNIHPLVLLLFAAALTGFLQPSYVWSSVGWYLSFLSFGGVLLLAPLVQKRLYGPKKEPNMLVQVCFETACAQLATLPISLLIFGKLSLLAIPANVLVGPFIPLAMLLTFIVGMIGQVSAIIAPWIALPATWIIGYMLTVIHILASLPWAQIVVSVSIVGAIVIVIALLFLGWLLWYRTKHDYLETSLID